MNIMYWLGYTYRGIEWKWARIRIKILHRLSNQCLNWSSYFIESASRILDSQDRYRRNEGSNNGRR